MTKRHWFYQPGSKGLLVMLLLLVAHLGVLAQSEITVTGKVRSDSSALEGVSVSLKANPAKSTQTLKGGIYSINVPANGTLVFSYIGYQTIEQAIEGNSKIDIKLVPDDKSLETVVVSVGFGTQKKTSMVSSITSVNPKELKGPTSNLTNMLAGRISGMVAYQRSGEPGADNASFFIRGLGSFGSGKVDPLILVDGIESTNTDLARLQPDDIATFSVLKDATAAAVYGARGANGVLIITTKAGVAGATSLTGRVENSISSNTRNFKLTDNITYMELANEAALTRNSPGGLPYSQTKINRTVAGDNPLLYPDNNWIDLLIKDYTANQRYNFGLSGGSPKARYYLAGTYNVDNGLLKRNELNGFDNNIKLRNYSIRSNIDLRFTNSTTASVRLYGQFDDYDGPIGDINEDGTMANGGRRVFRQAIWSNPVMFPAVYPQSYLPHINHPLFGNKIVPGTMGTLYTNPYASMMSGYAQINSSTLQAQVEVKQDLNALLPGLSARVMGYTRRYAYFDMSRSYNPFYYSPITLDDRTISGLLVLNDGSTGSVGTVGTEFLGYREGFKSVNSIFYTEAALNYAHTFNEKHEVSGMLIGVVRNYLNGNAGTLEASLPARNLGVSGRFTYGYDNRYMAEIDFGYNGSEKFDKTSRFGFFPSFGLAWNVSNEKFFQPLAGKITNLKLRATYGIVGNDQIGRSVDRFFYLSSANMNNEDYRYTFGLDYNYFRNGISVTRYANPDITWEKSRQLNVGMDLSLYKDFTVTVDAYRNLRSQILMQRSYIPTTMGLQSVVSANVGKAESKGVDIMLNYDKTINRDLWLQARGNFTYATSKILVYDEPTYADNLTHLYRVGSPNGQRFGLIAERLFYDDKEVRNSPTQTYGDVMAGDIKYHDMDGDGFITSNDIVPIGYPTTPEIIYGFGFSVGYKGFDLSSFFQGSARSSFFIDPQNISPFVRNGGAQNGLLQVIADNHWSEDVRNSYAFWPRMSNYFVANNNQTSTWWMRDGSFLRLKTMEVGYTFPTTFLRRIGFKTARAYVNGTNLFVWSKFDMWDPEMGGEGLGYPVQRVFNIGINFNL
ncbi:SusC/RagA family TonB-linked outer membrane protein [Paraflavitalea pollutisoli]|uniref:SusC/RagA family TonB-linked outer membrane protein n=1 Tax=Paraflavitalea pollutisoli TaxID=3034143 RepID=UPI0023EDCCDD|nr:TonB-dependent receptor [Paraflavitalea sp. H1-2-19X]